jgi:ferrochelatase
MRKAVLLVNLGSPDSPSVGDVRRFLREFLSDPSVIDLPWLLRKALLEGVILPLRPKRSAAAYARVWTKEGSPLVALSRRQAAGLEKRTGLSVHLAMRYGNPSIESAVGEIVRAGAEEVLAIPMFPHHAASSYQTAALRVKEVFHSLAPKVSLTIQPPFYAEEGYIGALAASAGPYLEKGCDRLLLSFHGIPERHLRKADPSHGHCLASEDCCKTPHPCHATCYRAQCLRTAELLTCRLGLEPGKVSVSFQSRLGKGRWLRPYTFVRLAEIAKEKPERLLVLCPSFVTDCLETLGEIAQEGRALYAEAGGGEITLVPCLNDSPAFLDFLAAKVRDWERAMR